ncbi:TetR/AcrR family transcriptional regulator [Microlunatus elymi]|uniref:TetR/AcrR family transcriptional regulator n=1 Tax=Microlunatus elymi TaxID=2596828 RepID=A0A516PXI2_9ACTN|nr:WHG domain-containing protein [Microlunatus elymi]QDP95885.1 TetR/AcrR family transcriptional regulator [Microlunatus elymi]
MSTTERRQRDRQAREKMIIGAARRIAEAEGWAAVTTRRLSDAIEYSQPVLYSHFPGGMSAVMDAVALQGFDELAEVVRASRHGTRSVRTRLARLVDGYLDFAAANPALYQAMFSHQGGLAFGVKDTPANLRAAFGEIVETIRPATDGRDVQVYAEVVWAALHGMAILTRDGRLPPAGRASRTRLLVDVLLH